MEKLKNKHNHALTQWLKVIIFAILMLAPFMSIAARCLYVICNKNAKDSYSGETYPSEEIINTNGTDLLLNTEYFLSKTSFESIANAQDGNIEIFINDLKIDPSQDYSLVKSIRFYVNANGTYEIFAMSESNTRLFFYNVSNGQYIVYFSIMQISNFSGNYDIKSKNIFNYIEYNQNFTLDNAFEYSVNHLADEQWIAWTKNTGIYTPINAMTSGLGFDAQTNVLAILLTYWSLLTAIYIVFDIIIVCFTKITHLISGND